MHFFVTGHTGFKGSWLTLLLNELGHEVSGYALEPAVGGLFDEANLQEDLKHHFIGDIRDLAHLRSAMEICQPDFAIHLAAQPLVLQSYKDPVETYTTNVDGTRNFLEAVTGLSIPPVALVVTTDKVYRDDGQGSYLENDPLGGHDPYSASKAMADLMTQSWAATNPQLKLHVARAGNVIGAYDVCENRLLPDAVRAIATGQRLLVRSPEAVRPWQHVLDCLNGYLRFVNQAHLNQDLPLVLNFGPDPSSICDVASVLEIAKSVNSSLEYIVEIRQDQRKETSILTLNSSASAHSLGWRNLLSLEDSIRMTLASIENANAKELCLSQVRSFISLPGANSTL